jgi:prespore-specific regulator
MAIKNSTDAREEFFVHNVEKWVTRSDAWTQEDDDKLSSIVLNHIRTGSTQLRAFEEAANELGRTAAACGYRWNGVLRKDLRAEIEAAKRDRKAAQQAGVSSTQSRRNAANSATVTSSDSMKDVIGFLQTFDAQYQKLRKQVDELEQDNARLRERIRELESQPARTARGESLADITPEQLEEDSKALFAIMERARKLLEVDGNKRSE